MRGKLIKKVCLLGDSSVGKTSLIRKYVYNTFDDSYIATIGTKVCKKSMVFDQSGVQVSIDMMIWDIMGQTSFRTLLQDAYFYGTHGVLAVIDSTRPETLDSIHDWVDSMKQVVGDVPIIFVSNKCDLEHGMTPEFLEAQLGKYGSQYLFVSAKTGENVTKAFNILGEAIIDKYFPEMKA